MALVSNGFSGFGYIIGILVEKPEIAAVVTPLAIVPTFLVSGFFVNQDQVPWFLSWIKLFAIVKYAY